MDSLTLSRLLNPRSFELAATDIALRLGVSLVLGIIIAFTYRKVHKAFAYSYSMVVGIVMLSMIVAIVLMVIDNSLARAFGLVGALAIIRFRTPVKDVKDMLFLFLAIAGGIASGTGNFRIGLMGVAAVVAVSYLLFVMKFGGPQKAGQLLLKVIAKSSFLKADGDGIETMLLDESLQKFCASFSLIELQTAREALCEIIYSVRLAGDADLGEMVAELSALDEIESVVVLSAVHNLDVQ